VRRAFFLSWAVFLLLLPREPWGGEARLQTASAHALLAYGAPDLAGEGPLADTFVHNGRRFAQAPLGPMLLLTFVEAPLFAMPHTDTGALAVRLAEAAFTAAAAALLVALSFSLYGATAALLFSTTLTVYARVPDGSVLAALLLFCGVLAARRFAAEPSRRSALWLGAAAGALLLFDLAATTPVLLLWALIFAGDRRAFRWALIPYVLGLVAFTAHRWFLPPQPRGDLLEGLDGLLLSTGKSLFLYSPPLLLALPALRQWWKTRRADFFLLTTLAAVVILPVAGRERWDGDPAWGPRLLVPLVPLLVWPAAEWLKLRRLGNWGRATVALLVAGGLAVQLLGVAFPAQTYLRVATAVKVATGAGGWFVHGEQTHFIPQFSPIQGHAFLLGKLLRHPEEKPAKPAKPAKPETPPWILIQPGNAKLDAEYQKLRLDWWALVLTRDTVKK
jgi:hypothetical protein